jgi:hypothetical protein
VWLWWRITPLSLRRKSVAWETKLARFPVPDQGQLDVLTPIDISTSPTGERVAINEGLAEILDRYPAGDPVHLAVSRSRGYLEESAR